MKRLNCRAMKKTTEKNNDDLLMEKLSRSDLEALKQLFQIHSESIFKYAVRIMNNPTEADDIVQEVFLRIWKYRQKYNPGNNFRAWAMRICSNLCLDSKRKHENKNVSLPDFLEPHDDSAPTIEENYIKDETTIRFSQSFYSLSIEEQHLLALRFDGDLSVTEAAEVLGCSIRTVHYRTASTIEKLRQLAGEQE